MKVKLLILGVLFLFLTTTVFTACELEKDEDEINESETSIQGVDKDIPRPGDQHDK